MALYSVQQEANLKVQTYSDLYSSQEKSNALAAFALTCLYKEFPEALKQNGQYHMLFTDPNRVDGYFTASITTKESGEHDVEIFNIVKRSLSIPNQGADSYFKARVLLQTNAEDLILIGEGDDSVGIAMRGKNNLQTIYSRLDIRDPKTTLTPSLQKLVKVEGQQKTCSHGACSQYLASPSINNEWKKILKGTVDDRPLQPLARVPGELQEVRFKGSMQRPPNTTVDEQEDELQSLDGWNS